MNGRVYDILGAPTPFDATDSFVTSPLLSPLALGLVRLFFAFWTLGHTLFVLIWVSARQHAGKTYVYFCFLVIESAFNCYSASTDFLSQ